MHPPPRQPHQFRLAARPDPIARGAAAVRMMIIKRLPARISQLMGSLGRIIMEVNAGSTRNKDAARMARKYPEFRKNPRTPKEMTNEICIEFKTVIFC